MNLFLSNKNFRLLWLSSTFAGAASNIVQYALSLYVLDMTQSAAAFAGVLAIVIFPRLALTPFAGVWGDRVDRKQALVWTSLADVVCLVGMGVLGVWLGELSLAAIYAIVIIMEVVEVWQSGPMQSVLPSLVTSEELGVATSWMHVDDGIVAVVTPFIAAMIYSQFSVAGSLMIGGVVLLGTTIGYCLMTIPPRKEAVVVHEGHHVLKNFWEDFVDGLQVAVTIPHAVQVLVAAVLVNFLLSPTFGVVMTTFLRVELQASNAEFSLYESLSAVIGIVTPMIAMKLMGHVKNPYRLLMSNLMGMVAGIGIVLAAVLFSMGVPGYRLGVFGGIFLGFMVVQVVVTYVNIGLSTLFGQIIPENYMGRIGATLGMLSTVSVPMGEFLFGHLMEWSNAAVCLAIAIVGLVTFVVISGKIDTQTEMVTEG